MKSNVKSIIESIENAKNRNLEVYTWKDLYIEVCNYLINKE